MTVTVLLFAAAREFVGQSKISIALDDDATVSDLRDVLQEKYPEMKTLLLSSNWSVNQAYVSLDHGLADGCEVGVIAPVSGG